MSVSQDTSDPAAGPGCGDKRRLKKTKTPGVYRRVDANGKTIGYVPATFQDPFGHMWGLASVREELTAEEMHARMRQYVGSENS